jgi:hypothetical protein
MKTSITLTTWNILNPGYAKLSYYGEISHKYLGWEEGRKESMHLFMKTLDSNIYCFQESTNKIAEEITNITRSHTNKNYELVWNERKPKSGDGCAIIYDKNVLNLLDMVICKHNDTHIIQCALFENVANKNKFWCFNTHVNFMTRNQDIIAMLKTTNKEEFNGYPKLIMGDFNAEAHEEWYKKLNEEMYMDAWAVKHGLNHKSLFTFSSGGKNPKYIDFVLTNGFEVGDIEHIVINGYDPTMSYLPNYQMPSDHLPQTITFKI